MTQPTDVIVHFTSPQTEALVQILAGVMLTYLAILWITKLVLDSREEKRANPKQKWGFHRSEE